MPEFKNVLFVTITGIGLYIGYVYYNKNSKQSIAPPEDVHKPPMDPVFIKTATTTINNKITTPPVSTTLNNVIDPPKLINNIVKVSTLNNTVIPNKLPVDNPVKVGSTASPNSTLNQSHPPPMPLEPIFKNKLIGGFPFK